MNLSNARKQLGLTASILGGTIFVLVGAGAVAAATMQNFDDPGTPYVGANVPVPPFHSNSAPPPTVMGPDAFSDGNYLRLKNTTIQTFNNIGFDITDPGAYNRLIADFDFRITCRGNRIGFGPGGFNGCADGFSIVFLDTGVFGLNGTAPVISESAQISSTVSPFPFVSSSSIGVGFRVFDPGFGSFPQNDVILVFNNSGLQRTLMSRSTFDLATGTGGIPGAFHHARLELTLGGSNPNTTLTLTHGVTGITITPLSNVDLSAIVRGGVPLGPFESRVAFGVRSGDAGIAVDLDNIHVQFLDLALAEECGNGVPEGSEECDDGEESEICDVDCTSAFCGDATVNLTAGEQCDDGNLDKTDGCLNSCEVDSDLDEVADDVDNCPGDVNSGQENNDGDPYGDVCDPDDDNDGTLDSLDNCPFEANPEQADFDGDGSGDACDLDDDNDGVLDEADLCAGTPPGAVHNTAGCSINQLVPCDGPFEGGAWKNHGHYVRTVVEAVQEFIAQGLIPQSEHGSIVSAAARSSCGK